MDKLSRKKKRVKKAINNSTNLAALYTLGFSYLFVIAEITYKIKVLHEVCTWEVILLFLIPAVYTIFIKLFSKSEIPLDMKGEPLPTGNTKEDKKKRNRFYRLNAFIYALIFAVVLAIGFLSSSMVSNVNIASELLFDKEIPNFLFGAIASLIMFPIVYLASLMVEYVWYEYKISQYNLLVLIREEAERENEENKETEEIKTEEDKEEITI
jgi:hypothetical protein